MKLPKLGIFLALLFPFFFAPMSKAQTKPYRVVCPIGTRPLPSGQTLDPTLDQLVAFMCVDRFGNVTFLSDAYLNTTGNPPNSGSGPPVGTCTAGAIYVDTTTGTLYTCNGTWNLVTATSFSYAQTGLDPIFTSVVNSGGIALTQTAKTVPPGTALMGPIPTGNATKPTFEVSTTNNATGSNTVSVTNTPLVNPSVVVYINANALNDHTAPAGGYTAIDSAFPGYTAFKNLSSLSPVTSTTTLGASTTWAALSLMFGGSITSVANNAALTTSCGTACLSGALTVTANNLVLVAVTWSSATKDFSMLSATDTCGNSYSFVAHSYIAGGSGLGVDALVAQFAVGGSCTITVRGDASLGINFSARAYNLSGPTSFYSGDTGPFVFRYPTSADLFSSIGGLGFSKIQTQNAAGCTVATASTYDVCKQTIAWPIPFADTNYFVFLQCRDGQPAAGSSASNDSIILFADSANFTASSFVAITQNNRSIAQTCPTIFALGAHP